jgi:hypothetical protein
VSNVKVLFVGNSYTDQIQTTFKKTLANTAHENSEFMFVWGGGATLQRLIDNGRALKWIRKQKWDYVVLQEQSKRPVIPGRNKEAFHASVDTLVGEIRGIGAEPLLYMTWGHRDGDARHGELLPDYETMQEALVVEYKKAGARNSLRVVPVGEAWRLVRRADAELGHRLYKEDGSHPSASGAFLVTCVFLRVLFDESLEHLAIPEGLDHRDCTLIKDIVAGMEMPSR